ncbi:MAG: helix-turn-helix transcriptional regulator [Holophagaceae bacterium]|nr:helix-turn-helix transcriptional regulator [Holophagaceae bacterium]
MELGLAHGMQRSAEAILVLPDVPHRLLGGGQLLALLFLEPESALGRSLLEPLSDTPTLTLEAAQARVLRTSLPPIALDTGIDTEARLLSLFHSLAPIGSSPFLPSDPRVLRTIRWLKTLGGNGSLEGAAQAQGLSASRLGHLFSAEVGVPFRPFALWLRLQGAFGHLAQGSNLTQAAHEAGFADSAHLTRTFRRMFGITPSSLAQAAGIDVEKKIDDPSRSSSRRDNH